jgi:hypothetical protein
MGITIIMVRLRAGDAAPRRAARGRAGGGQRARRHGNCGGGSRPGAQRGEPGAARRIPVAGRDHHIHTLYHVRHANAYGLDWIVITDHGCAQHVKIGVEKVNPDIVAASAQVPDTLVF